MSGEQAGDMTQEERLMKRELPSLPFLFSSDTGIGFKGYSWAYANEMEDLN